jgi:hypothetical protein
MLPCFRQRLACGYDSQFADLQLPGHIARPGGEYEDSAIGVDPAKLKKKLWRS